MLKEWIESIFTRTTPLYRRLGYVYASVALQARYGRCRKAWQQHVDRCCLSILKNVPQKNGTILLIGSGHLYEIPWREMLNRCDRLVLMDVVHPRSVQALAKKQKKIELVTCDATGISEVFSDEDAVKNLRFQPPRDLVKGPIDAVVSANVLSQLALEPFAAAKKKWRWANDDFFVRLAQKVSGDHIAWLKKFSAPVTLVISDYERQYFSPQNEPLETMPSAGVYREGKLLDEWEWHIAPLGEVSQQFSYKMRVECRSLNANT